MRKILTVFKKIFSKKFLVILMLLVQAGITGFFLLNTAAKFKVVEDIILVLSIILVLYVINQPLKNEYKIIWVILIIAVPIVGCGMYIISRVQSPYNHHIEKFTRFSDKKGELLRDNLSLLESDELKESPYITSMRYLSNKAGFAVFAEEESVYYADTVEYFDDLRRDLESAKKFIFLEFFIISDGYMWSEIRDILLKKAKEGLDVRLIYDGMGCLDLPGRYYKKLSEQGIKCLPFHPFRPLWSTMQNNRNHRKIVVIDGEMCYTGGANLADEYIGRKERFGKWKDSCIKISGKAVASFTAMFLDMWDSVKEYEEEFSYFIPTMENVVDESIVEDPHDDSQYIKAISGGIPKEKSYVQPFCDCPTDGEYVSQNVFLHMIASAKDYLYITTPYLIIDEVLNENLTLAAKSGVDVRIITPHIPDKKLVFLVTRSSYKRLIESGVKIYEYTPGFIHSKIMVSDDRNAVIGTTNMDFRSLCLHYECGIRLYNSPSVIDMKNDFLAVQSESMQITADFIRHQSVLTKRAQEIMRLFAPLL